MNEDPRADEIRAALAEHLVKVNGGMAETPDVVFPSSEDEARYIDATLKAIDGVADGSLLEASLTVLATVLLSSLGVVDAAEPTGLAEANVLLSTTDGLIVHTWVTSGALTTLVSALAVQHAQCQCPWSPQHITATVLEQVRLVMPLMVEQLAANMGE